MEIWLTPQAHKTLHSVMMRGVMPNYFIILDPLETEATVLMAIKIPHRSESTLILYHTTQPLRHQATEGL